MLFAIFLKSKNVLFFDTDRIPKIMVQFCYLRLHFGIDIVSRRLLQWIARIENVLKRKPTTRYRAHVQQPDKYSPGTAETILKWWG